MLNDLELTKSFINHHTKPDLALVISLDRRERFSESIPRRELLITGGLTLTSTLPDPTPHGDNLPTP